MLPVKTRQIPVSVVAEHEESDFRNFRVAQITTFFTSP